VDSKTRTTGQVSDRARNWVSDVMAAGDPQRVWFQEMVDTLRSKWHRDMSFEAIIRLRDELDGMLHQIRSERQIRSPLFRCRNAARR
jgi:hypothetical protein